MFKFMKENPIFTLLMAGYLFTVSFEIMNYKCKDFEVSYGTCNSGAITSGLMNGMVWPFYWVSKLREE